MKKILVMAPHPDDEMLGVGGTIIKEIDQGNSIYVCIITRGVEPVFHCDAVERTRQETRDCHKSIGVTETIFLDFPAVMLEKENRYDINGKILDVIQKIKPDEVYVPHWGDMQKDHQIVVESCMVALRPKYKHIVKRIYAYETMSETGWNIPSIQNEFIPNVYVDITLYMERKKRALGFYSSQMGVFPDVRSLDAIEALAKYRGTMMHLEAAEAFVLIREIR